MNAASDIAWLDDCPADLRPALLACARGGTPPNVALMRLFMQAGTEAEATGALVSALRRLESRPGGEDAARRLREALRLARANPQAFSIVKGVLIEADHSSAEVDPSRWAVAFDRAARASPEGAVALYALGDPRLLRAATCEVVERMRDWDLLGGHRAALEIGCGIGRFLEALSPHLGTITGTDVSAEMVAEARRRCRGLPNVRVLQVDGRDLSAFASGSLDLVLAADSFPYLVQSGMDLAERHVADIARVLRPGGDCLILNVSYRGDLQQDRADLARLAGAAGLEVLRSGTRDLSLWDAAAFHLHRPAG